MEKEKHYLMLRSMPRGGGKRELFLEVGRFTKGVLISTAICPRGDLIKPFAENPVEKNDWLPHAWSELIDLWWNLTGVQCLCSGDNPIDNPVLDMTHRNNARCKDATYMILIKDASKVYGMSSRLVEIMRQYLFDMEALFTPFKMGRTLKGTTTLFKTIYGQS